jgi:REP element-mobilizing transposase RayT
MPQSLSAVYLHLVFSTKERRPLFADADLRIRLHEYIGAVSRELDCPPLQIGGIADHVHLLVRHGREVTQSELVKEVKRVSSRWLKAQGAAFKDFEWQGGYAVFSVSPSNLDRVRDYVANQEQHHRRFDYQSELRTLLRRHGLEWNEKFLWD